MKKIFVAFSFVLLCSGFIHAADQDSLFARDLHKIRCETIDRLRENTARDKGLVLYFGSELLVQDLLHEEAMAETFFGSNIQTFLQNLHAYAGQLSAEVSVNITEEKARETLREKAATAQERLLAEHSRDFSLWKTEADRIRALPEYAELLAPLAALKAAAIEAGIDYNREVLSYEYSDYDDGDITASDGETA